MAMLDREKDIPAEVAPLIGAQLTDHDPTVRAAAAKALRGGWGCSEATIRALGAAARDSDREVRSTSLDALGDCKLKALPVLQAISAALEDPDRTVRLYAMTVIGAIGPPAIGQAARLRTFLNEKDSWVRHIAVQSLAGLLTWNDADYAVQQSYPISAEDRASVMKGLAAALKDPAVDVRKEATAGLESLVATWISDSTLVQQAFALSEDAESAVRLEAVALLAKLAHIEENIGVAEAASERLGARLHDEAQPVRLAAAKALQESKTPEFFLDDLTAALGDPSASVRKEVLQSLAAQAKAVGASGAIAERLADPVPEVRLAVAHALKKTGDPNDERTLRTLINAMADPSPNVRGSVAEAAGDLVAARQIEIVEQRKDPTADELNHAVVERCEQLLADDDPDVRKLAAEALQAAAPLTPVSDRTIRRALSDDRWEVRQSAVRIIASFGDQGARFKPDVAARLRDDRVVNVRYDAAKALNGLGPDASDVAVLRAALSSDDTDLVAEALRGLLLTGKAAAPAVQDIIGALGRSACHPDLCGTLLAAIGPEAVQELARVEAQTPQESKPGGLMGALTSTRKERFQLAIEAAKKGNAPHLYKALDRHGKEVSLQVDARNPIIGVATWCHYSNDWRKAVQSTALAPYFKRHPLRIVLSDEWRTVERMLDEEIAAGNIPASERSTRLEAMKKRANNGPLFDPTFIDSPLFEVYFAAPDAPTPKSFPAVYDAEHNRFDGGLDSALSALPVPTKLSEIARKLADAEERRAQEDQE